MPLTSSASDRSAGANPCTVTEETPGSVSWSGLSNVLSDDSNAALSGTISGTLSPTKRIQLVNWGLDDVVPDDALQILGIEIGVNRACVQTGSLTIQDDTIQLVVGGTASGDNKATTNDWPGGDVPAVARYGGSTDLWGLSLNPEEVRASDFGVVIAAKNKAGLGNKTAKVYHVTMSVWWKNWIGRVERASRVRRMHRREGR